MEKTTETKKVGFDGRIPYMMILGGYLNTAATYRQGGDLENWRLALKGLLDHIFPYINSESATPIDKILNSAAGSTARNSRESLRQALAIAHRKLNILAKDIYLPTRTEDLEDLENFFG